MTDITRTFTDGGGASMNILDVNGRYLTPDMTTEHWKNMVDMKMRSDDVIVCSYPKSGTNWTWDIVTMLRRRDASPVRDHMYSYIIDLPFNSIPKLESQPAPRVLTSHRYYLELPSQARLGPCKIVYMLRDPRDITVSYYHHLTQLKSLGYEGKLEHFVQLFIAGRILFNSWWEHVLRWSEVNEHYPDQPLLVLHYEDMKKDPETTVRRLAVFLGVEASDDLIRGIVHNTSFDAMKKHKESLNFRQAGRYKRGSNIIYRKGEVDDWKNWLCEEQWQKMMNFFNTKLASINLGALESARRYFV